MKGPPCSCSSLSSVAPELPLRPPRAAWNLVRTINGLLPGGGWVKKVKTVSVVIERRGKFRTLSHLAGGRGGSPLSS